MAAGDRYDPARDVTPAFLDRVATWIEATGEVLVVLRYLRAAGAKDFALCRTRQEFESLVSSARRGTDICVFRDRQLPLRGVVDEAFVELALRSIADEDDFILLTTEVRPGPWISLSGDIGLSHAELRESLAELMGADVALGRWPDYLCDDHDGLVSAAKDGIDGPR